MLFFPPLLLANLLNFIFFSLQTLELISNSAIQAANVIFPASVDNFFQSVSISTLQDESCCQEDGLGPQLFVTSGKNGVVAGTVRG